MILTREHQRFKIPLATISIIAFLLACSLFVQDMKVGSGVSIYTVTFDIDPDPTGTIQFDGTQYLDGNTVVKNLGTYSITGGPAAPNDFLRWETSGGISVGDSNLGSTTATVSGTGTLRMVTQLPQEPSTLSPVGGVTINVNKFTVVAPYIAITGIVVVMIAFIRRRID